MTDDAPVSDQRHHAREMAEHAARALAAATGVARHDVALVLGSGWAGAADLLGTEVARLPLADLPGFHAPATAGHAVTVRSVRTPGGAHVLVLGSRTHLYEGHGAGAVAHPVRTAAAAGCRAVVLTNGCGSIRPTWPPGTAVLIADHLNLTGATPLVGPDFVDLTDLYSTRLRTLARAAAAADVVPGAPAPGLPDLPELPEGVYAQFCGPQYETPAEVRMAGILGADLVGMSTALEAIAARAAGLEVLGVSLVTNLAAGVGGGALSHDEVIATGRASADRLAPLLARIVTAVASAPIPPETLR